MKRLLGVLLFVAALLFASTAKAAVPCTPIKDQDNVAFKVATVGVPCKKGREVVRRFRLIWDKVPHRSGYVHVLGFRCGGGLGGSQVVCWSWNKWVFGSSRPEDHLAGWSPGKPRLRRYSAESIVRKALRRKFSAWSAGYAKKVNCGKRLSRKTRRCRFSWIVGDSYYYGNLRVRIVPRRWSLRYRVAGPVKRLNAYCADTGGSNCLSHLRLGPITL